ncbi:MAG TPA: hypothetical protein PKC76_15605 [Saprospiraceae bacterium]|nr:hypothetical protein [Saprospiraceae bacterium]HMP25560.1 hypothetical protein [Saprospiraceae bacterium]
MKPRLVLWGNDAQDERVLIALELRADDNKVTIYTFPENVVTEEFHQKMMDEWRIGNVLDFPEGFTESERPLAVTEDLLPADLRVERTDVVQRAQTEWHFTVLSTKLNEAYHAELSALKDRIEKLEAYDSSIWSELKGFWDKVQTQVRDRNLIREHSDTLRNATNELFAHMKNMRSKLDEQFEQVSEENYNRFMEMLAAVEQKVSEGLRLAPIFDELKDLQRKFRDAKFGREHRAKVWERLDAAFKMVKEKRFGAAAGSNDDKSPLDRLQRRYEGLISAIEKMERSIKRDRDDLNFQNRKIERTDGQLEAQLRQAKIKMIEERIRSKEEKLTEMTNTRADLEKKLQQQQAKEAERQKIAEAKRLAQEKIAQEMKEREESLKEEEDKLVKAAEQILGEKTESPTAPEEEAPATVETAAEAMPEATTLAEEVEEVVEEVAETVEDVFEEAIEKIAEIAEEAVAKVEEAVEKISESKDEAPESEDKT